MLAEAIANIHRSSRACYGVRRAHAELVNGLGMRVGRDQVALVMSRLGLHGISGTRKRYVNREHLITAEDLVQRKFTATARNQLWCTDITEHPTTWIPAIVATRTGGGVGEFNRSSQHLDYGGLKRWRERIGVRRPVMSRNGCGGSGVRIGRCDRQSWTSRVQLASAMFEWIEGWYNPERRHSSLGMVSPAHFEQLDNNVMVAA